MKQKKINWKILNILIVVIAIGFGIFIGRNSHKKTMLHSFDQFYKTNIHGKLKEVSSAYRSTGFKIEGKNELFVFDPSPIATNKKNTFNFIATVGDTIYKPSYSDTLKLVHSGKEYFYIFKNYRDIFK